MNKGDTIETAQQNNVKIWYVPNFVTITTDNDNYYLSCGVTIPQRSNGVINIVVQTKRA